ncbi:MAG TPA: hypothetical protein VGO64_00525 [Candidatus Limnocylindrales bacterium]|jgi:hypothetical protein|nr:hypothetical protein [Candidatus Limnocylindrales bacterium]
MDPNLRIIQDLRLEHQHSDGSWSPLEPAHHGEPAHDGERSWLRGLIFRCGSCSETVRVTTAGDAQVEPAQR